MENMDRIFKALMSIDSEATFNVDIEGIITSWESSVHPSVPTEQEIADEIIDLEKLEYKLLRAKEYPSIGDQLDMQYHDSINGTTTWKDSIVAVKLKYPKPE